MPDPSRSGVLRTLGKVPMTRWPFHWFSGLVSAATPRQQWISHTGRFRPAAAPRSPIERHQASKRPQARVLATFAPVTVLRLCPPQVKRVLPRHQAIRGARARHPASDRPRNRVTARGYRLPAVDEADLRLGCEPRPRTGLHRRGGICACAGAGAGWRAFGAAAAGANRKPCKPCFLVRRWRNAALAPPVLEYRQEGPLSPGASLL